MRCAPCNNGDDELIVTVNRSFHAAQHPRVLITFYNIFKVGTINLFSQYSIHEFTVN